MVVHTPREGPRTTLQKHLDFFDTDHDDVISIVDTYVGFRDIAYSIWFAALASFVIHVAFSYPSLPHYETSERGSPILYIWTFPQRLFSYLPSPLLKIYLKNIDKDIHGSDSGTYNSDGGFENTKFDEIFEKFSSAPYKDRLSPWDTYNMWKSQWRLLDIFGPIANAAEWFAVWYTLWPGVDGGWITKDDLKGIFDGSIYYKLAEQRSGKGKGMLNGNKTD